MEDSDGLSKNTVEKLRAIYEEMMWLANRPNVSASRARSWYTHVMAEAVKNEIRFFTGMVSSKAVTDKQASLRLEHFKRIQNALTLFVGRHRRLLVPAPDDFVQFIHEFEKVHVVTFQENYEAMKAKGDYSKAKITLIRWDNIPVTRQAEIWKTMLKGKVANAKAFLPPLVGISI
jgi:hypothetical protein